MLVANSFDLWQKDTFFSAAEEVQQSADIMESAYRTWLRARKEGSMLPQHLDALGRELQMALGTAKWQLEEFERAIHLSYRIHRDDITVSRHTQFVSTIKEKISNVEAAFKESFKENGKDPFRWVNLDEQECDDLALFLSGASGAPQTVSIEKNITRGNSFLNHRINLKIQVPNQEQRLSEIVPINEDTSQDEITVVEVGNQGDRRIWYSPKKGTLEIVIDGDDGEGNTPSEGKSKEEVSRPLFSSPNKGAAVSSHTQSRMTSWVNQQWRGHRSQRQQPVSPLLPINSIRFVLALMLTVFLVAPFLVYST